VRNKFLNKNKHRNYPVKRCWYKKNHDHTSYPECCPDSHNYCLYGCSDNLGCTRYW